MRRARTEPWCRPKAHRRYGRPRCIQTHTHADTLLKHAFGICGDFLFLGMRCPWWPVTPPSKSPTESNPPTLWTSTPRHRPAQHFPPRSHTRPHHFLVGHALSVCPFLLSHFFLFLFYLSPLLSLARGAPLQQHSRLSTFAYVTCSSRGWVFSFVIRRRRREMYGDNEHGMHTYFYMCTVYVGSMWSHQKLHRQVSAWWSRYPKKYQHDRRYILLQPNINFQLYCLSYVYVYTREYISSCRRNKATCLSAIL